MSSAVLLLLILPAVLVIVICLWICLKYNYVFSISAATIHLQPVVLGGAGSERKPVIKNAGTDRLISKETYLRRAAYKNTSIKTGESFFNDADMHSDYYLLVVYDKKTGTPLLSVRYYFNKALIAACLKGDENAGNTENTTLVKNDKVFLADRLSGNTGSAIYRRRRNYIYALFYTELFRHTKNCNSIIMARKEPQDKLMKKYLRLGLAVKGMVTHKGKEHWILSGNVNSSYAGLNIPATLRLLLKVKQILQR